MLGPRHGRSALLGALVLLIGSASEASATYSIVAADESTGEVGGASASCVGSSGVARIYGSAPGIGVVHAQASSSPSLRDEAVRRLVAGESPSELLAAITDPSFDGNAATRQYGVVALDAAAAGFTGSEAMLYADDMQGRFGSFVYSVQGNLLTGETVLERSRGAFVGGGCDLPERLMLALEAGGADGAGDRRCTGSGVPADAAFIQVDGPGEAAGAYLSLEVRDTGTDDPVALLRTRFDEWRASHPCPERPSDAGIRADADAGRGTARPSGCAASPAAARAGWALVLLLPLRRRWGRLAGPSRRSARDLHRG